MGAYSTYARVQDKPPHQILLTVEDINDHAPLFVRDEYVGSVKDNTPIGRVYKLILEFNPSTEHVWHLTAYTFTEDNKLDDDY